METEILKNELDEAKVKLATSELREAQLLASLERIKYLCNYKGSPVVEATAKGNIWEEAHRALTSAKPAYEARLKEVERVLEAITPMRLVYNVVKIDILKKDLEAERDSINEKLGEM